MLLGRSKRFIWAIVVALVSSFIVCSHGDELLEEPTSDELDDIFAFRGIVYRQDDKGNRSGNPHIREDATIYEGIFLLQNRVRESDAWRATFTGDLVSAASYDDVRSRAETVSAATGYNPGRWDLNLAWLHETDYGTLFDFHASHGREFAYASNGVGFSIKQTLAEESTQLSLSFQHYDDTVRVIRFDGSKEPDEQRLSNTIAIGWTQSLTPISVLNLSYSRTEQSGFLQTSFNPVLVDGEFEFESLPESRHRNAYSLRYKRAINKDSWQLGLSQYSDDWGIDATTAEFRYYFNLSDGERRFEPSFRYYDQSAADYHAFEFFESGDPTPPYRTSDSDLGELTGWSGGLSYSFKAASWFSPHRADYDIGFNYYQRSDNLDFYWLTLGWRFPY